MSIRLNADQLSQVRYSMKRALRNDSDDGIIRGDERLDIEAAVEEIINAVLPPENAVDSSAK